MDVFGAPRGGDPRLSLVFGLLAIPPGCGPGGRCSGAGPALCAALLAREPVPHEYAQETRMYSLVILLGAGRRPRPSCTCSRSGRRGYLPLSRGPRRMLYTHNWALFFGVARRRVVLVRPRRARRAAPHRADAAIAFGGAGLLFLPWSRRSLFQVAHTGAPWANPPRADGSLSASRLLGRARPRPCSLLGGGAGVVAVLVAQPGDAAARALALLASLVARSRSRGWSRRRRPPWAHRYLAVPRPAAGPRRRGLARAGSSAWSPCRSCASGRAPRSPTTRATSRR